MKSKLLIALIFSVFALTTFAQQGNDQKIKAWRVATITDKLNLTPDESAAFWPVYNERESKIQTLRKSLNAEKRGIANKSDEEIEAFILKQLQTQKEIVDINIEYFHKMKDIIPMRKIAKLQVAEKEFQKMLLERMQEIRKERMQNRQNGFNKGPRG